MTTITAPSTHVAVVGAGIIGVTIALELQGRGRSVVLLDRGDPGGGASYGNMASIAVTEFMPISRPAVWRQIPRWIMDPDGPIRIRPTYAPVLVPWFLRFLKAGRPAHLKALEAAGAALCKRVYDDLLPLLAKTGLSGFLSSEGCLRIYADDSELAHDREHLEALERFGFPYEMLSSEIIREIEPSLAPSIRRAVLLPQNRSIRDPFQLVRALFERFLSMGGRFDRSNVEGFEHNDDRLAGLRLAGGRVLPVDEVVLCAGAYTGRLSRLLGEPIPLETERGYHTQVTNPGISLRHSLIRPAKAFMVTPTAGGIRIGGTVELAGLKAAPDYRRSKITVNRAREVLPTLQTNQCSEWMGHRPALPDTIPIISRSRRHKDVFYATGHGHLGLTLSATTARIIADLAMDRAPPLDISPYRIDRF